MQRLDRPIPQALIWMGTGRYLQPSFAVCSRMVSASRGNSDCYDLLWCARAVGPLAYGSHCRILMNSYNTGVQLRDVPNVFWMIHGSFVRCCLYTVPGHCSQQSGCALQ